MRYNAAHCGDIDKVLCPPYDVISPREQERLHERSPHNMTRLVLGRQYPSDGPTDNRYTRAAATLQEWVRRGILFCDKVPSLYVNEHTFTLNGRAHRRRGLLDRRYNAAPRSRRARP